MPHVSPEIAQDVAVKELMSCKPLGVTSGHHEQGWNMWYLSKCLHHEPACEPVWPSGKALGW